MVGARVRRFFEERFVRNYDDCMKPLERRAFGAARGRLLPRACGRVLEIGAGTGVNFAYYTGRATSVVATDVEPRMLAQSAARAREAKVPVRLTVASAERLPFGDRVFDTVVATLVFCTIPRPERAFAEIARVLVPRGRLILLEHVRSHVWPLAIAQDVATPVQRMVAAGCCLNRRTQLLAKESGFSPTTSRARFFGIVVEIEATLGGPS